MGDRSPKAALGATLRSARSALAGSAVVLTYHRVCRLDDDPHGLAIDPALFDSQMAVLAAGHTVLRASELADLITRRRRLPRRAVVVTFDDGYDDLLTTVKPILAAHSVPATAFVSTAEIGSTRERWWDELGVLAEDEATRRRLREHLATADVPERETLLDSLAAERGVPRPERADRRSLDADGIRALSSGGLVDIGAHTVSHRPLAALPPAEQHRELTESKRALEAILHTPVTLASYPFGGRDAVGAQTPGIAREAGFAAAFANWPGLAFPWTSPHAIPRHTPEPLDADGFSALLDHWFSLGR